MTRPRPPWQILVIAIAMTLVAQDRPATTATRFHYASRMSGNADLVARSREGVVFDSDHEDRPVRFHLEDGSHRVCLDGGHEFFDGVVVESEELGIIPAHVDRNGCAVVEVASGMYLVRPARKVGPQPAPHATTVLTADLPSPPLLTPQGQPRPGFWAIYPPSDDTQRMPVPGRLRANPPYRSLNLFPYAFSSAMPIVAEYSTVQMDEYSLIQLNPGSQAILVGPQGAFLDFSVAGPFPVDTAGTVVVSNQRCPEGPDHCDNFNPRADPLRVVDLHTASQFWIVRASTDRGAESIYFSLFSTPLAHTLNVLSFCPWCSGNATFALVFRFFSDGTQAGALYQGEAALFQQSGYQGKTAIYAASTSNVTSLASPATMIDKAVASIKLGPNTVATIYPEENYGGTATVITSNDNSISNIPQVGSIRIGSLTAYMLSNKGCNGCDFQGIDLSGLDLTGFSLKNAKFGGATLTNTKFNGASLAGADFTGAKMSCADFSGTDKDHLNDLTQTSFPNIQIIPSQTCRIGLKYAKLSANTLAAALWKSVDLSGAVFTDLQGKTLSSQAQPLDLTGAVLTGSSLQNAVLDYATGIPAANVTGTVFDGGSLKGCNLQKAVLDGANFQATDLTAATWAGASLKRANLDHAVGIEKFDFSSVTLEYTSFRYMNLTGNSLAGKDLQTIILDYATGLSGTDMSLVKLNNASLKHVNLSGTNLQGAHLDRANLDGANMAGVQLDKPPGQNTSAAFLTQAFLRNVNLSQAKMSAADFTNANFFGSIAVGGNTCQPDGNGFTPGCATASGATMDGTVFSGANLFGVDFSSSKGSGTIFGGAFLAGANFSSAQLVVETSGRDTGFPSAFLQGARFDGATFTGTMSFSGAFVDYTGTDNKAIVYLPGENTQFAGYWGTTGERACVRMEYKGATAPPATDANTICPDGNQHSGGCGDPNAANSFWMSGTSLTGRASFENSPPPYNNPSDNQTLCQYDRKWLQ